MGHCHLCVMEIISSVINQWILLIDASSFKVLTLKRSPNSNFPYGVQEKKEQRLMHIGLIPFYTCSIFKKIWRNTCENATINYLRAPQRGNFTTSCSWKTCRYKLLRCRRVVISSSPNLHLVVMQIFPRASSTCTVPLLTHCVITPSCAVEHCAIDCRPTHLFLEMQHYVC